LFERTVLRDVMTPCTVFLRPQETVGEAIELCKRTRLDDLVVIDGKGKLLGVCQRAELHAQDDDSTRQVLEVMATEVQTFAAGESLASPRNITGDVASPVVVVDERRPSAVTCNSLVALSRPSRWQSGLIALPRYERVSCSCPTRALKPRSRNDPGRAASRMSPMRRRQHAPMPGCRADDHLLITTVK
jgi:hypothetical protein